MIMKKITALLLCVGIIHATKAQQYSIDDLNQTVFLYPAFYKGKVLFKNKSEQQAIFNYNTLFQQMIYVQNGVMLALDQIANIDTVYVDTLKYVPVDTIFYEVRMAKSAVPLFIKYESDVAKPGPATPFGGNSQTGAVQNVSSYRFNAATPYQLKVPEAYTVRKWTEYYIMSDGELVHVNGMKQLQQIYPDNEKQLSKFVHSNHTSFNKTSDMEQLVSFIATLK